MIRMPDSEPGSPIWAIGRLGRGLGGVPEVGRTHLAAGLVAAV